MTYDNTKEFLAVSESRRQADQSATLSRVYLRFAVL